MNEEYLMEARGFLKFVEPLPRVKDVTQARKDLREALDHPKWFKVTAEGVRLHHMITLDDNIEVDVARIALRFEVEGSIVVVGENPGDVWRIVVSQDDPKFIVERATLTWPDGTEFSE